MWAVDPDPNLFGVEVELEGREIIDRTGVLGKYWSAHNDGSLRQLRPGDQAIEYVLNKPTNWENTKFAVNLLCKFLTLPDKKVYDSYRTSIHVHVNCLQETMGTIYNYITLATIFDELLVSQNGEHRIGNNFCLRMKDAEGVIHDLMESIANHGNVNGIHQNNRYSSVNIGSLLKFGTIEFRSLECTTDANRILHWIETCQAMKQAAREYANPREIITQFSQEGPAQFLVHILGPLAEKYTNVPDMQRMLYTGARLAQDLAYCSDWKANAAAKPPPKPRKKVDPNAAFRILDIEPVRPDWPPGNPPVPQVVARALGNGDEWDVAPPPPQNIWANPLLVPIVDDDEDFVDLAEDEDDDDEEEEEF
jgi:hypothetical protein